MAYSSGGLIAATDYNNLVGTSTSTTSGQINTVWAVGNGARGFGQTAVSTVSATGLVTATQWATLTNAINSTLAHQSATGVGLTANTAGQTITAVTSVTTALTTVYNNAALFATQGTTTTGSVFSPAISVAVGTAYNAVYATRSVTFSSGNAARYFFNAGGQINLVVTGVTNNNATARSADAVTLIGTNFGGYTVFRNTTSGGRTGTGGTLNTNATTVGYRGLTATSLGTTLSLITSTTASYTTDQHVLYAYTSAQNVSGNGDFGATVYLQLALYSPAHSGFNDALNVTVNHRVDIVYPETTNLTNSWGTATVA
jgi:hypothetical protein